MNFQQKILLSFFSFIGLTIIAATPVMAFDLSKVIERSFEKSIDRNVRKTENSVTNEIDKTVDNAISSIIPDLSINAKKDDGQQKNLSKGIVVFGFDGCSNCQQAYAFMNKNNIRYQIMDPQQDVKARRIAEQKGINTVPVIYVSGDRVDGFTESSYTQLFKKHGVMK
ncbi:MAG: glutaredoxin family protein [Cocleimonas sp.]